MIPEHLTYLLVDLFCILVPFLFSFHPLLRFYRQWRYFLLPCLLTASFFLIWDGLFTGWGVWGFNHAYVLGPFLFGMPVEEFLFFLCIPYASVFSYHCFGLFLPRLRGQYRLAAAFFLLQAVVLFLLAFGHPAQWYTSVTFILLAAYSLFLLVRKVDFLALFLVTYLFILIPFVLSNGVLTGSFLGRVVVWYNNERNLGIRILTIPVEDIFYGMLLLLMNVGGYEYLRKRAQP
ncbi:lycopene cyclase domain-containing protein [Rurimicrobium arvi]|uniref:Lycopene cyclase domain-containing protein n=1 Tax=Rurimicrobium arvi TaxID=2049916 RepID=A0ABP8MD86_9BACT